MSDTSSTSEAVLVALRKIVRAIELHSRSLVTRHGITGPQLMILRELDQNGQMQPGQIAREISLSQATVSVILDRLEKRGLVQRIRSTSDRRRVIVTLTPEGDQVLQNNPPLLQERFVTRLEGLAPSEQARILDTLDTVVTMMAAGDIDAAPLLVSGAIASSGSSMQEPSSHDDRQSPDEDTPGPRRAG